MEHTNAITVVIYKDTTKETLDEKLIPHDLESMEDFIVRVTERMREVFMVMKSNNSAQYLVPHLIGNPIDAIDSFVSMAKKQLQSGNQEKAIQLLDEAESPLEEAKTIINDFRTGKYES